VPQDIIPQWQREAERFFGRKPQIISDIAQARKTAEFLAKGGSGWYISYYEALSRNGRVFELKPFGITNHLTTDRVWDMDDCEWKEQTQRVPLDDKQFCPLCSEPASRGQWYPKRGICEKCGHIHILKKVKPLYSQLTTAFKKGTIVIDEVTKIKSNDTLTSLAVRGLRSHHKLALTGTPVKNFIPDAFWPLWWSLGNNSPRFPFSYDGGYMKFSTMFAVAEYTLGEYSRKEAKKILPEVTNLSVLWKLFSSSIIRRRKENTGEQIAPITFHPITAPWGAGQRKFYSDWLNENNFTQFFIATHPDSNIARFPNLVARSAAILGQLWKLEQATTLPTAEPSGWFAIPKDGNWTPANIKVLELAEQHAKAGDKVIIGSDLKNYGPWIAKQLAKKGVKVLHITKESASGELTTLPPVKRAKLIHSFIEDSTSVLCASTSAMMLGHNLSVANVVILRGLPWDYSSLFQFIARAHRLTSKRPVKVYVVMTQSSLDQKKWQLLEDKTAAAELAVDGDLFAKKEEPINLQEMLEELIEKGLPDYEQTFFEAKLKEEFLSGKVKPATATHDPYDGKFPNVQQSLFSAFFDSQKPKPTRRRKKRKKITTSEQATQLNLFSS